MLCAAQAPAAPFATKHTERKSVALVWVSMHACSCLCCVSRPVGQGRSQAQLQHS